MTGTTVSFPITGGNATIYKKGDVTPYVQGKIEHQGSGLSLTGGGHHGRADELRHRPGQQLEADR